MTDLLITLLNFVIQQSLDCDCYSMLLFVILCHLMTNYFPNDPNDLNASNTPRFPNSLIIKQIPPPTLSGEGYFIPLL